MTFCFHHSAQGESPILIPQIGLTLRVCVPPQSTGDVLTCIETVNAPGFGPPLHRHRETEIFYVLEGRYLFEVGGARFVAETGDVVTAPGGTPHAFVNITDRPARQFVQILPGMDATAFFIGLGEVMHDGKLDKDALNAFGQQWHVEFLGPPLQAPVCTPTRSLNMKKHLPMIGLVGLLTISVAGHAADTPKPLALWQCHDFLAVQETYQPVVVSYAEALDNKGKAEEAVVDVEGITTRTPLVVKQCNENPKMMLRDALAGLKK